MFPVKWCGCHNHDVVYLHSQSSKDKQSRIFSLQFFTIILVHCLKQGELVIISQKVFNNLFIQSIKSHTDVGKRKFCKTQSRQIDNVIFQHVHQKFNPEAVNWRQTKLKTRLTKHCQRSLYCSLSFHSLT